MTKRRELGQLGEEMVCGYLVEKGYRIIERNFKKPWGELDIIALASDKTLVFVEVKTSLTDSGFKPEDQMTSAKLKKFKRAAALYANQQSKIIDDELGWRLDLVAVVLKDKPIFRHYKNIV